MAVPDVAAGVAFEAYRDAGGGAGIAARGVLPAGFAGRRRLGRGGEKRALQAVGFSGKRLAFEDTKANLVQMDEMGVVGEVE